MARSENTREAPTWWQAWNQLINPLVRIGSCGSPEPELFATLKVLESQGCAVAGILNWRPSPQESDRLRWAGYEMEWALNPKLSMAERETHKNALLMQLDGPAQHWRDLTALALVYVSNYWRNRDRRDITWSSPGGRLPGHRLTTDVDKDVPRTKHLAHGSPTAFPTHAVYSIFIDESFGDGELKDEAVIAGVVWAGNTLLQAELPSIPSHLWTLDDLRNTQCKQALNRLLECPRGLPIVIRFLKPDLNPGGDRKDLIQAFLKVLLGWVLPRGASVEIFIEQHGKDQAGEMPTEYYNGVFSSAAWQSSKRYKRWKLKRVHTVATSDQGYVGYADLLAYVAAMQRTELGAWFDCNRLPGYFSVPFDIVRLLERTEEADSSRDPEAVLDCFQALFGTGLEDLTLPDIGKVLLNSDAQNRVLEALEERYKSKDRNLKTLSLQLAAVKKYLLPHTLPSETTFRMRLLLQVLELQDSNHVGDSSRGREAACTYLSIRDEAFVKDSRLVAHVDCNLAVHYCDQLNFFAAERVLLNLRQDPAFNSYDPLQKAVIESSLGQVSSMQRYKKADWHFANALAFLEEADLTAPRRRGERTQIETYRAINAIDDNSPSAAGMVETVLGLTLLEAARKFASTPGHPFQHYLLLRYLYSSNASVDTSIVDTYVDLTCSASHSPRGNQHPWGLIEMYRGLLQFQRREDKAASASFCRAISVLEGRPGILTMIRAMISAVALCCFSNPAFEESARDSFDAAELEPRTSEEARVISLLRAICSTPAPARVNEALSALPFNYH